MNSFGYKDVSPSLMYPFNLRFFFPPVMLDPVLCSILKDRLWEDGCKPHNSSLRGPFASLIGSCYNLVSEWLPKVPMQRSVISAALSRGGRTFKRRV